MFKAIICSLAVVLSSFTFLHSANEDLKSVSVTCSKQLQQILNKILSVTEARKLITEIQSEGNIRILVSNHPLAKQFGAFWDVDERTICVNMRSIKSEGEMIGSILFELHNAAANSKIEHIYDLATKGKITRENYVKEMEYLEYVNSIKCAALAKKGISQGIFPKNACLHTYKSFEEHFYFQKKEGHSAFVAKTYDMLASERTVSPRSRH